MMNVYMARQPIFDTENHVYGYELLYRSNGKQNEYNGVDGDESTADVVTNAFFGLNINEIIGGSKAFINFTSNLLKRGVPKMISPDLVVVEVLENLMMDDQLLGACQELKERGYTLALDDFEYDHSYSELFELGDIVKIDFRTPQKSIEETSYICRYCNKLMLAEKIESQEEFEYAKRLGCSFMQGYFFAKPTIMSKSSLTPLPLNLMRVMQLVSQPEPEFSDIVDVISCDTAMCQRLLRLINSVYFGVRNRVSSISQALVILGLDYLREWIYLMGMQRITHIDNVEVMRLSLLLAKFCKRLALMVPQAQPDADSYYLMGLLSMVTYGGERALAQALEEFPLTQEIKNGLMGKGGIYSDIFDLAYSYEKGDWETVDKYVEQYHLDSSKVSEAFVQCVKEAEKIRLM
ncbi:MAG: HDOD domain-containing protein [Oscillospiraceae bacterium]|nr:HDOD domain-containing protein [Oscillospiraceae bacterium]